MRSFRSRVCFAAAGWAMIGLGVSCTVDGGLGVTPFDVTNTGLARTFHIDVGTASWFSGALLVAVSWLCGRRPAWGTLAGAVLVGAVVNLALPVVPSPSNLVAQAAVSLVGVMLVWAGAVAVVTSHVGEAPVELVMLAVHGRGLSMRHVRWGLEALLFLAGVALGGDWGIVTLLFVLVTGPVFAWALPLAQRLVHDQEPIEVVFGDV